MKKTMLVVISCIGFLVLGLFWYFFPIMTDRRYGESPLCWYKFGVYACEYNSESGGNTFLGGSIHIYFRVGGVAEYLLLKDIKGKM